tara:strand:+ start:292 stop:408 length:117 start_codon:yes stop_codon:yes gene_type:complete
VFHLLNNGKPVYVKTRIEECKVNLLNETLEKDVKKEAG